MNADVSSIEIFGVRIAQLTPDEALQHIERLYDSGAPATVFYVNAHTLNLARADRSYADVLSRASLVLNDGKGLLLGGRILRRVFPADLNGNFFTPLLLERAAESRWPVFFLGGRPGVAEEASRRLKEWIPELVVAGTRDGYFSREEDDVVAEHVRSTGATILLVALGNPLQERWLDRCLAASGARVGVGVGAFFDFQSGAVRRAPGWMNRLGLEWLHRLAKDPKRMWRRYLLGNPAFMWALVRRHLSSRGKGGG